MSTSWSVSDASAATTWRGLALEEELAEAHAGHGLDLGQVGQRLGERRAEPDEPLGGQDVVSADGLLDGGREGLLHRGARR